MAATIESLQTELERDYRARTPASAALYERAQAALPGGDTRQSVFFRPYPLFLEAGEGAYVEDADGNRYLDCLNCASALILGHAHPVVVEAVTGQVARGTAFAAPNRYAAELAEVIKERLPSIEKLRFVASGTEATMLSVRAARALTGRPKIVKMRGAYHGSHDDFLVRDGVPQAGIAPGVVENVLEVEFNDPDDVSRVFAEQGDQIAAVIVEGVLGSSGMIAPERGYFEHLRELTERHGTVLIFDEVISLRLSAGGAQGVYGVRPDLTAMGKIIGGGLPVGAFGGRDDLMQQFSPLAERPLSHSGTFNANPITMVAGLATLGELDADSFGYINRLGERFAAGVERIARTRGVPLQVSGAGSLRNVHFAQHVPRNGSDGLAGDRELLHLLHLKLLLAGALCAPRGMFAFSTVTTEQELDGLLDKLDAAVAWLQSVIEARLPAMAAKGGL